MRVTHDLYVLVQDQMSHTELLYMLMVLPVLLLLLLLLLQILSVLLVVVCSEQSDG